MANQPAMQLCIDCAKKQRARPLKVLACAGLCLAYTDSKLKLCPRDTRPTSTIGQSLLSSGHLSR